MPKLSIPEEIPVIIQKSGPKIVTDSEAALARSGPPAPRRHVLNLGNTIKPKMPFFHT